MMKIRSLQIEHFRKFTEPVSLSGLSDGVNVLAECNEFGKSTILAAIRGVLFERHSSKAQGVVAMQHWANKTSPKVTLEFELAGHAYRVEKQFLHREPYARLKLPNGTLHEGDEAEDQLQKILHFTRAGKTGSKAEDIGMWGALWVTQRDSVDQPELPMSARQTIQGCLDSEVGVLTGGTRGTALLVGVRADLAKIQNGNGKPSGRYKDAIAELDLTNARVAASESKRQLLARDIADLGSAKRKLTQADASGELARTEEMLRDAQSKHLAAQRYEEQEKLAVTNQGIAERHLLDVERAVTERRTLEKKLAEAAKRVSLAVAAELEASNENSRAASALQQQREKAHRATESCDSAGQALRQARALFDLSARFQTLTTLQSRLKQAEMAQERVNTLRAQLLAFTVTEEGAKAAESAAEQLQKTKNSLEAQATQVTFELLPEAVNQIQLNGAALSETQVFLIKDLVIQVDGIGTIRIQPGIKDRDVQLSRQTKEQQTLHNALAAISADSIEEAREQLAARRKCERDQLDAQREVSRLTPTDPAAKIAAGIEPLRNHVAVLTAACDADLVRAGLDQALELDEAKRQLNSAEEQEAVLSGAASVAQAPLKHLDEDHVRTVRIHALAQGEVEGARKEQTDLTRDYEQVCGGESEQTLAGRRDSAAAEVIVQKGVVADIQRSRPVDSVAAMNARILRYQEAKKLISEDRAETLREIAVLESRIAREEGVGIEEQLGEAQRIRDDLNQECARFQREIQVLELLRSTLEQAEREAKERYMAPVVQRITPYLQRLFPGAGIHCDENFQITALARDAGHKERFAGLSDGTQEQIAVLTRLAFADMLLDSGHPAMVILDDALAYSDSDRLERMFDVLTEASTRMQILVLTCRGELFTRLGGKRVRALRSAS